MHVSAAQKLIKSRAVAKATTEPLLFCGGQGSCIGLTRKSLNAWASILILRFQNPPFQSLSAPDRGFFFSFSLLFFLLRVRCYRSRERASAAGAKCFSAPKPGETGAGWHCCCCCCYEQHRVPKGFVCMCERAQRTHQDCCCCSSTVKRVRKVEIERDFVPRHKNVFLSLSSSLLSALSHFTLSLTRFFTIPSKRRHFPGNIETLLFNVCLFSKQMSHGDTIFYVLIFMQYDLSVKCIFL